jgi:hypothetical protein
MHANGVFGVFGEYKKKDEKLAGSGQKLRQHHRVSAQSKSRVFV